MSSSEKVKESDWSYRPADRMRSLKELASHLTAIPEADLAIMQERKRTSSPGLKRNMVLCSRLTKWLQLCRKDSTLSNVYDFPLRRGF
ncbi:hypothetical protein PO124_28610 [Bacillus licheniformis]|nr:hypothetical protein [Bacillus licheniformis]